MANTERSVMSRLPRTLVVGGHSRNIGKSSLIVDIIRAFPQARWTAVKITQFGHGICSKHAGDCGCSPGSDSFALQAEPFPDSTTDSGRFLEAGAASSYWLRSREGCLAEAMPEVRKLLSRAEHTILESNSLLAFIRPELFLMVLDPACTDFKESARRFVTHADALVFRRETPRRALPAEWQLPVSVVESIPRFFQAPGAALPEDLRAFLARRYFSDGACGKEPHRHLSS